MPGRCIWAAPTTEPCHVPVAKTGIGLIPWTTTRQQLEACLGTRLLHRTTRRVGLTPDGEALLQRAQSLIADVDEMEQQFRPQAHGISGRLRVDVPSRIARRLIAPALPGFLEPHPALDIDLGSSDRMIDLVHEGIDCALRVGPLSSNTLVAKPLGHFALINCASPAYLARYGSPQTPQDLHVHLAVNYVSATSGRTAPWEWQDNGQTRTRTMTSRVSANNAETYIALSLAGLGLIQIPVFDVHGHLARGDLVRVLAGYDPAPMPVHMVYPHRRHAALRLQVFIRWVEQLLSQQSRLHPETPALHGLSRAPATDSDVENGQSAG